jgi:hypothetical protein
VGMFQKVKIFMAARNELAASTEYGVGDTITLRSTGNELRGP